MVSGIESRTKARRARMGDVSTENGRLGKAMLGKGMLWAGDAWDKKSEGARVGMELEKEQGFALLPFFFSVWNCGRTGGYIWESEGGRPRPGHSRWHDGQ
jgi:hypothetical protein